jgi:anti-sigma-K factor RskA
MMTDNEDHIVLAAEYALGTLDAEERARAEAMMFTDEDFMAMVEMWERQLGVLSQMVGSTEPRAEVWERIRAAIGQAGSQLPPAMPQASPSSANRPATDPVSRTSSVVQFRAQARRWRGVAAVMTAVAAALVAVVATQISRPDLLPESLRAKPGVQVAQAPAANAAQYVAILQKDGNAPAFILTVDNATKNFTVRKVGAQPAPGKSYELWLVSDTLQAPRSLGVIGGEEFTARAALAAYDANTINQATYAVTVEPEGGSPTGAATGPIVFTGKLIETVPAAKPDAH